MTHSETRQKKVRSRSCSQIKDLRNQANQQNLRCSRRFIPLPKGLLGSRSSAAIQPATNDGPVLPRLLSPADGRRTGRSSPPGRSRSLSRFHFRAPPANRRRLGRYTGHTNKSTGEDTVFSRGCLAAWLLSACILAAAGRDIWSVLIAADSGWLVGSPAAERAALRPSFPATFPSWIRLP